jgi:hypothetical protein
VGSRGVLRIATALVSTLLVAGCLGHHSSAAAVPTVKRTVLGIDPPATVASEMASRCASSHGKVGLDLHEGTVHVRTQFTCALARDDQSGLADELVELVANRNDASTRADLINTLAHEVGVNPYPRADMVWEIGTGGDGCYRIDDVDFHRQELAETAAGSRPETPVHWAEVEAVRYAGTCPQKLGAFFDTLAQAGQPAAARTVRAELEHLGVKV